MNFAVVVRTVQRMCVAQEYCPNCPAFALECNGALLEIEDPDTLEAIAAKWAAENPEPPKEDAP